MKALRAYWRPRLELDREMKRVFLFPILLPAVFALGTIVLLAPQAAAARIQIQSVATTVFIAALFPTVILLGVDWASASFGRWLRVSRAVKEKPRDRRG
jgi:hypothetical protein